MLAILTCFALLHGAKPVPAEIAIRFYSCRADQGPQSLLLFASGEGLAASEFSCSWVSTSIAMV